MGICAGLGAVRRIVGKKIRREALIEVTVRPNTWTTSIESRSSSPEVTVMATTTKTARTARKAWAKPRVECYETRPEVTAYAGDSNPWAVR